MATDIFDEARAVECKFVVGTHKTEPQKKKIISAPFMLLHIGSPITDVYIMPTPTLTEVKSDVGLLSSDENSADFLLGRENGIAFYSGDVLVFEQHQFGDYVGQPETFIGLHQFGLV